MKGNSKETKNMEKGKWYTLPKTNTLANGLKIRKKDMGL